MNKYTTEGGNVTGVSKSNKTSGIQLPMIKNSLIGIMSDNKLVNGGIKSTNQSRIKLDNKLLPVNSPDK